MEQISGIYKVTSPSGKIYIGQSIDCIRAKNDYRLYRCKGKTKLYRSLKKYGWENHKFEIIYECNPSELNYWEKYYGDLFQVLDKDKGLNLRECGGGHGRMSEESIERMRKSQTGKKLSEETKMKLRIANTGKKMSKEAIEKTRQAKIGMKMPKEAIEKMRQTKLGKKDTEETKRKKSESNKKSNTSKFLVDYIKTNGSPMKGKKHTQETKQKISETKKLQYENNPELKKLVSEKTKDAMMLPEIRNKISKTWFVNGNTLNRGRKYSEQSIKKMSDSHKGQKAWNKGLIGDPRMKCSEERKEKISVGFRKRKYRFFQEQINLFNQYNNN